MADNDAGASREILRDSFTRLIEHVDNLTSDLTEHAASYRPAPQANTITWLIWHSARVQDLQICHIAGTLADPGDIWTRDGWVDRFALDLPRHDTGYGHTAAEVAKVTASAELLAGYYHAVHDMTLDFVARLTPPDLARVIDTSWEPPVTASMRLVSIVDDCAQHLGQASYLRGIA